LTLQLPEILIPCLYVTNIDVFFAGFQWYDVMTKKFGRERHSFITTMWWYNILYHAPCITQAIFINFKGEPYIMLGNKLYLMTRFALYRNNTLSWISIVLAHWNKSVDRHVAPLGHIILIPSQPIFGLTP
jgi:hypothetical protein